MIKLVTATNGWVFSDIHGNFTLVQLMIEKINQLKPNPTIFSVGDLIDRGPNSYEAGSLVFSPNFHSVRGNHEQMMIDQLINHSGTDWMYNGGTWFHHHPYINELINLAEKFNTLPHVIIVDNHKKQTAIVHGELIKLKDMYPTDITTRDIVNNKFSINHALWGRTKFNNVTNCWDKIDIDVICGHTQVPTPTKISSHLFIDAGCGYDTTLYGTIARLIAYDIDENRAYGGYMKDNQLVWEEQEIEVSTN